MYILLNVLKMILFLYIWNTSKTLLLLLLLYLIIIIIYIIFSKNINPIITRNPAQYKRNMEDA